MFYLLTIFAPAFEPVAAVLGTTPLMLAVLVGAAQNILSKSSKYSLFDPCKEMAYIPLDYESKTKGKAAIDVVGNPLGKSGGAMIQQVLIFAVGSLAAATPVSIHSIRGHFDTLPRLTHAFSFLFYPQYLAVILAAVVFLWYRSANSLATKFDEAMSVDANNI